MISEGVEPMLYAFLLPAFIFSSLSLTPPVCEKNIQSLTFEQKVKEAIAQLGNVKESSQVELISIWTRSVEDLQSLNSEWRATAIKGPNGSIAFLGTLHHALLFTHEGGIQKGFIYPDDFNARGEWDGEIHKALWLRRPNP